MGHIAADERRKIVGGNAVRIFSLDKQRTAKRMTIIDGGDAIRSETSGIRYQGSLERAADHPQIGFAPARKG